VKENEVSKTDQSHAVDGTDKIMQELVQTVWHVIARAHVDELQGFNSP